MLQSTIAPACGCFVYKFIERVRSCRFCRIMIHGTIVVVYTYTSLWIVVYVCLFFLVLCYELGFSDLKYNNGDVLVLPSHCFDRIHSNSQTITHYVIICLVA